MRTTRKIGIGAALILTIAAGAYTRHRQTEQRIDWTSGLHAPNRRPGFALRFKVARPSCHTPDERRGAQWLPR